MNPFFTYFGGKHRLARWLGRPRYQHVIEPFAGSAGYSLFWAPNFAKQVTLVERDPMVAGVWDYLLKASPAEILALPWNIQSLEEVPHLPQEARWLIGFHFNHATQRRGITRSKWARRPGDAASFWSPTMIHRIAHQVPKIRHWQLIEGDYADAPNVEAHWHVDPPYSGRSGREYSFNQVDYELLAAWWRMPQFLLK